MGNTCRGEVVDTLFVDDSPVEKERSVGFDKLLFPNPTEWRTMKKFCQKLDVRQYDLNLVYKIYCSDDAVYVREYRVRTMDVKIHYLGWDPIFQEIADIFMPSVFMKEFGGLDDPYSADEVSFARFIITSYIFCAQPLCDLVYDLIASVRDRLDLKISSTIFAYNLNEMFLLMTEGHTKTYLIKFLLQLFSMIDIEKEISVKQVLKLSMKYPVLFYSLERFRKDVRRKCFGDRFWCGNKKLSIDPENPKGPPLQDGLRVKPQSSTTSSSSAAAAAASQAPSNKKASSGGANLDDSLIGEGGTPRKVLRPACKIPLTEFMYLESMQAFTDSAMSNETDAQRYTAASIISDMEFLLKNTSTKTDFSKTFANSTYKAPVRNKKVESTSANAAIFIDSSLPPLEKSEYYEITATELLGMVKNDVHRMEYSPLKIAKFLFLDEVWDDSPPSSSDPEALPSSKQHNNQDLFIEKRSHIKIISLELFTFVKQFFGYKTAKDIILSSGIPFSDDCKPEFLSNRQELSDPLHVFGEDRFYNASVKKEFVYNVRTDRRSWLFRIWDHDDESKVYRESAHSISENSISILPKAGNNLASIPEETDNNNKAAANKKRGGK